MTEPPETPVAETERAEVTLLEVLTFVAVLLVASIATWSLALAQLGRHDGWLATGLGLATTVVGAVVARRVQRPVVRFERTELLLGAATVVAALFMFLPGAPYAYGDKDPGVYVSHAFAIAREGDVVIPDRVLDRVEEPVMFSPGARYPGFWVEAEHPRSVTPQFFHLYAATAATVIDLVGPAGMWTLNPLLAALSTLAVTLAVRRATGTLAAALAATLLVLCMPQVWQAKYTSTEILAQLLLAAAVLGGVSSLRGRWVGGAALAGIAVGTGFLSRPDGVLYVLLGLALVCGLHALRWREARVNWFLLGLAVTLPYALWNAYALREGYTLANTVPRLIVLAAAVGAMALVAEVVRRRRPAGPARGPSRRAQRIIGVTIVVAAAIGLVAAWNRESWFGEDYTYFGTQLIPSYDERNLIWLSYFFTPAGLIAMWAGICVVLLPRWRAALLLLVGPGLALMPLYLYEAKVSPRLMWWIRRFIPGIVPSIVVLIAVFLAWALLQRRWPVRIAGGVLAVVLAVQFAAQSLPLRSHRELGGSYTFGQELASIAPGPDDGVLLFAWPTHGIHDPNRNLPGPVWFIHDRTTALLPVEPTMADVEEYAEAFPGEPIYVLTSDGELPDGLDATRFRESSRHRGAISTWEETVQGRPDESFGLPQLVVAWEYLG
jgi:hypothetical protein